MREEYFRCEENLNKSLCLEISPLCFPILNPHNINSRFLDICSTEELKKKYEKDTNVDKDKIVNINYVDLGESYQSVVGNERFQLIIASHVIEHVPNVIKWLNGIAAILNDDGIVKLAVPDKRYCFDFERRLTTVSDMIGAFIEDRGKPTPERVYDHFMFTRPELNSPVFHHEGQVAPKFIPTKKMHDYVYNIAESARHKYIDVHCSVWTPEAFVEQMNFVSKAGLLNLELVEAEMLDTQKNTNEFFVTFKRK
jgi:hypothetical protein